VIGSRLGNRYEIIKEIGRGGMGVVYLANDPVLDRNVAIKVVTPDVVSPESAERFKREARVVAKMDHPSIVSVHDSGEHEGSLFFVMPFVEGANLRSILKNENLSLGDLIEVAVQVADALEYSHTRGVVHRDIKPENLMVTHKEGEGIRVRVTDFGLAMAPAQERITKTATIVGTLAYMSPEQVAGREVDSRSDIYAFGTLLYECLVGEPPFSGEVQVLLYRISHEIPVPPHTLNPDIDEEIEDVLLRCLEKDPTKRPTGKEIAERLSAYRRKLLTSGRNRALLKSSTTMSFQLPRPAMRPFVGREKEFADLQKRLNAAISGECQFVLVSGEAGIGKSRLIEELENLARVRSIAVFHGRFVEVSHPLPYQGFGEVIQEYFRSKSSSITPVDFSDLASDLIALFPVLAEIKELAIHTEDSSRSMQESGTRKFEDRTYIFELLARTITRIAAGKPIVLSFEDLHAANVSIEALDYIVRRLGPTPTLIVGTYRTTEVDKRHPIMNLLSGFKGDKRFAQLQLTPLSQSGHRQFLELLMGGSKLGDDLVQKFYDATEGNPYFTSELVRSLIDSGGIVRDDTGSYKLSSETALNIEELPVTIQQTVEERIERLSKDLREVLSVASVLGKSFEYRDLEMLESEHEDLESAVEQLIRESFIEEDRQSRSDRLSFSSGVMRDVLYSSLPRRRRRALHKKHAEEIEKRNSGRLERVYPQLFEHYVQGDVSEKVIEYGFLLAKKSLDAFSPADAISVLQTVLDFLEEEGGERSVEAEARKLLAAAHRMMGNADVALEEMQAAVQILEKEKDSSALVSALLNAAEIAWQGRKVDETRKLVEKGLSLAATEKANDVEAKLLSMAATIANLRGEYDKAREYLSKAERFSPVAEEVKEESTQGGRLVVAMTNPCKARHPANAFFTEESEVLANVFETLVTTNPHGNLIPHLCERWEAFQQGAVFQFVIRNNIHLHDGRLLTAEHVKESFCYAIRTPSDVPAFATVRGASEYRNGDAPDVSGIKALSDHLLQVELLDPLPIYPALLTNLRSAVAVKTESNQPEGSSFVGTGQFRIESFKNDSILLNRNTNYWKDNAPFLDSLEFQTSLSSAEVGQGFRSGKFDIVRDLLPRDLEEILRDRQLHAAFVEAPKKSTYFVVFNWFSPICKNLQLRKALSGVIRTRDLVRRTLGRFAEPSEGILPPGILGHDPGKRSQPISFEKATELIQSSGLSLPIRLHACVHPILQDRYSSFLKGLLENWQELGIETSIETPDGESYNAAFLNNQGLDLLIGRWIADYDDPDTFTYGLFHTEFGELRNYHSSKELDELMVEARSKSEPTDREKLYRKIESVLHDTSAYQPLFHEIDYRVVSPKVRKLHVRSTPPYVNYSELSKTETISEPVSRKTLGGTLRIPSIAEVKTLDPARIVTGSEAAVFSALFETLTSAVEGARIVPWLASSFQAEDGATKFRFHLRDDVRFHNGRRLTARDVRYSFEHLLLTAETSYRSFLSPIRGAREMLSGQTKELKGFRVVSATEFVVELEEPLPFFPSLLTFAVTAIIPEGAEHFHGSWKDGCVGTGPFRLTSFEPGRAIKMEANPNYWRSGFPKSEALDVALANSPQEILSGFKSGEFSIATDLPPSDVEALLHSSSSALKYQDIPGLSTYYIIFNIYRGPFADQSVRQRFIEAVDVESLTRRVLGRLAVPAVSLTPPSLLGHQPSRRFISRSKKSQNPVEITAMIHSIYEGQYAFFKNELFKVLNEAGFKIKVVETKAEYYEPQGIPITDLTFTRWLADYPDADTFLHSLLHSEKGWEGKFCGGPDLDHLIESSRRESDVKNRHILFKQVEEMLQENALVLPLFHEQTFAFSRPEIEGLELSFFSPFIHWEKAWSRR
jgi:ABC-type transport system substrate-binding protein/serine/threonine protein kinase